MKKFSMFESLLILFFAVLFGTVSQAQNPIIRNQYSADPSARVFGNKVYIFPSHDILAEPGKGRPGWFCMEDYHVFSSENLTDWTDHGVIVTQNKVPWVMPDSYAMWAPDCVERNGKYYFYFPAAPKDTSGRNRFTVGVAIADKPEGPYVPQATSIANIRGIDPNVFIDKDGQAYLYWSAGNIYAAKLKENMVELDSDVKTLGELPTKGLKEGPFLFERNGVYYLTYPHVENKIERLEYATGNSPLGPFKVTGVIMDESPTGCWTNHHSIVNFKNQWYLFYHHNDYSPAFDKARSVRADSLSFNEDGTIQKVRPTLRGIGVAKANSVLQIDRYSAMSDDGASIAFIDTANRFEGWKTVFTKPGAWMQFNTVAFGAKTKSVSVKAAAANGAVLEVRLDNPSGPVVAEIVLAKQAAFSMITKNVAAVKPGIHNLVVQLKQGNDAEIDWVRFE